MGGRECSHQVPKGFSSSSSVPQCVSNSTSILSNIVWRQDNFHVYNCKGEARGSKSVLLFWGREAYLGFYVGECSMGQSMWFLLFFLKL